MASDVLDFCVIKKKKNSSASVTLIVMKFITCNLIDKEGKSR